MAIIDNEQALFTPELLAPVVETRVFEDVEHAAFWIGAIATPETVELPAEYEAARKLRANVYIDECKFLPESARQADGGESDQDDLRAIQLAAIENGSMDEKLVGTARLIIKKDADQPLPVEHIFPEAFISNPASVGSVEASRFIARHSDRLTQHTISLSLMRTMAAHAYESQAEHIYAVIESHLARLFTNVGLPFEQIAAAKQVEEYDNTENMAVRFDPKEIFAVVERDVKKEKIISTFFNDALENLGVGHYDKTLISPIE